MEISEAVKRCAHNLVMIRAISEETYNEALWQIQTALDEATAAKAAEIERLRAENKRLRAACEEALDWSLDNVVPMLCEALGEEE